VAGNQLPHAGQIRTELSLCQRWFLPPGRHDYVILQRPSENFTGTSSSLIIKPKQSRGSARVQMLQSYPGALSVDGVDDGAFF